ncbi:glycosyltransferase [Ornithinimicrobium pratense]|uniref:Glycosyltransferase n=1 Tax=Ornithinimicrobium pratense TaxID=2593973 RepID=A0A5J6V1G8_9MICO|nr:glycosyltransferase [Ornithinimicrobium pratense]QFG67407.1 glycosyltransferase [Ornithinimicrobium pratense]
MTRLRHPLLHVVPGPAQHGVTRHGLGLHHHLAAVHGQDVELLRCRRLDELEDGALAGRVAVVQVTDRLVAGDAEAAVTTWRRLIGGVARLTAVLHDLPQRSDGRSRPARSRLYATLAASADEVVVASRHEWLLLAAVLRWACPLQAEAVLSRTRVVPLPIERAAAQGWEDPDPGEPGVLTVVTLGFVYPGKGLEEVVDAAALAARDPRLAGRRIEVRNLGRASEGHEDLLGQLQARAAAAGVTWSTSGWVDDADLPRLVATSAATVPVAAHRHVSASGSVATWLAAGRRPLVLTSRYAEELARRLPGAVRLVRPPDLARAVADALADPVTTVLRDGTPLGPSWAQAASALHEVATRPAVSVVVPYYRDQRLLDLILARLQAQTGVVGDLEVVVADDGSPEPPDVGAGPGVDLDALDRGVDAGAVRSIRVVRQHRDGFRASAARNLGARHSHGRVLCFLDGDTVPEDTYVAALQRTCLQAPTLALGRRRHAHLTGAWPPPPEDELPEPAWLDQGYRASDHLRAADDGSFRFVISAVMALTRPVWDAAGGFEEGLTGYGGEDWELAWRCWLAGADLCHVPEAVAWHDGPDLAGRAEQVAVVKNAETLRLSPLLPHPLVRGRGWTHPQPDVVAVVRTKGWTPGQVVVVVEALLRLGDVGVWAGPSALPPEVADPRVHPGSPDTAVLARARATVEVTRPVAVTRVPWTAYPLDLTGAVSLPRSPLVDQGTSGVRVTARRHKGRHHLHGEPMPPAWLPQDWVEPVQPEVVLERWRQGRP